MRQYLELLQKTLEHGHVRGDRTGTGTRSLFGERMEIDLRAGFPLLTTKKVWWDGVVAELLWMLSGSTSVRPLQEQGVHIWDDWADEAGELGPVYGAQWRRWEDEVDQVQALVEGIRSGPESRRHVVSAWNAARIGEMRLPPCHAMFQMYVEGGTLSCQMVQRSADLFIGVPFNIASYALLTMMVAHATGLEAGRLVHVLGDVHVYENHVEVCERQLARAPRTRPKVRITTAPQAGKTHVEIDEIQAKDIILEGYRPHGALRAAIAV